MEKVLIVGINSFLSVQLVNLLKDKFDVSGVYNQNRNNIPKDIKLYSSDELSGLTDDFKYVFVVSAYVPEKDCSDEEKLVKINVELTKNLLNKFKSARFIYTSSVSVYGKQNGVINESTIGNDINAYGLSKLRAEEFVRKHNSFAILRVSSMFGVGMKTNTFLPIIIKNAIIANEICIYGEGTRLQNYIHVKDVAKMMYKAALCNDNLIGLAVAQKSISNKEVAELVKESIAEVNISMIGEDNEISYEYDANYTYKILDFIPTIKLNDGIIELIKWIKK